eukprot:scaffold64865_cov66-Phaeocystis_antarctica.AAC.3
MAPAPTTAALLFASFMARLLSARAACAAVTDSGPPDNSPTSTVMAPASVMATVFASTPCSVRSLRWLSAVAAAAAAAGSWQSRTSTAMPVEAHTELVA